MEDGYPLPSWDEHSHIEFMDSVGIARSILEKVVAKVKNEIAQDSDLGKYAEDIFLKNAMKLFRLHPTKTVNAGSHIREQISPCRRRNIASYMTEAIENRRVSTID